MANHAIIRFAALNSEAIGAQATRTGAAKILFLRYPPRTAFDHENRQNLVSSVGIFYDFVIDHIENFY